MKFYEQLAKHQKNHIEEFTHIWPNEDWTTEDYKELFKYIEEGWIIQGDAYYLGTNGFVINDEWEDEPLWTPPPKKIKFKIITKEEKVRRGIMKIRKQYEQNEKKKFTKVLEDCSNGVDIREATIKNVGQNFQNKVDKLLDKLEIEDTLRDYFV